MISDRGAVGLAAAAAAGAALPYRNALPLSLVVAALAVVSRWPVVAAFAVALAASGLAQRSLDGLDGLRVQSLAAEVTLLTDPKPRFDGVQVDVRWQGRRLVAIADGSVARDLEPRLAGERVRVRGSLRPVEAGQPWLVARHIAGELDVVRVERWRPGDPASRLANALRRTLVEGSAPLSERDRSLYTGLVIGDDRHQPPDLADDFLGAGLSHLLAVSGQNVAFTLAVAAPLLRRLRIWPRWLATLGVVALFGVATRFEPSVTRAAAMAALATTLAVSGRPVRRARILGLAVTGLVLVDPLLVRSAGFQLSVAAALAIVLLAPRVGMAIPGPAWWRQSLGVTIAAQLGVAPVLLATFGPIPLASLPANLLAVPVAGWVMAWGLTGGLAAGLAGGTVAEVLHVPTGAALAWLEEVAHRLAHAPLGQLHASQVVGVAAGLGIAVAARRSTALRRLGRAVALTVVVSAVLLAHRTPPLRTAMAPGVVRWHARGTDVVVLGGAGGRGSLHGPTVLEALRRDAVGSIDLLIVADRSVPAAVADLVVEAHLTGAIVAPDQSSATVDVGALRVRVVAVSDRLVVDAVART